MAICSEDIASKIRTCAPFLNRNQLYSFLKSLCEENAEFPCYEVVPAGTDVEDFIEVAFGGSIPSGCKEIIVIYDDGSQMWTTSTSQINWCNILQQPQLQTAFKISTTVNQIVNTGSPVSEQVEFDTTQFDYGELTDTVTNTVLFRIGYFGYWKLGIFLHAVPSSDDEATIIIRSTAGSPIALKQYIKESVLLKNGTVINFSFSGVVEIEEDQELEVILTGNTANPITIVNSATVFQTNFWGYKLRSSF